VPVLPLLDEWVAVGPDDFVVVPASDPPASGPLEQSKTARTPNTDDAIGNAPGRGHAEVRRLPPASASRIDC
jgi:hypothetical protein